MKKLLVPATTFFIGFTLAGILTFSVMQFHANYQVRTTNSQLQGFYFMVLELLRKGEHKELIKRTEFNACAYMHLPSQFQSKKSIEQTIQYFSEHYPNEENKCEQ